MALMLRGSVVRDVVWVVVFSHVMWRMFCVVGKSSKIWRAACSVKLTSAWV